MEVESRWKLFAEFSGPEEPELTQEQIEVLEN